MDTTFVDDLGADSIQIIIESKKSLLKSQTKMLKILRGDAVEQIKNAINS